MYPFHGLSLSSGADPILPWWNTIGKLKAKPRSKLFFWCALKGIVPTGDYLTRRSIYGPSWCIFCKAASENTDHIFLFCLTIHTLWTNIRNQLGIAENWTENDLSDAWEAWTRSHPGSKLLNLPIVASWYTWLARNRTIFDEQLIVWNLVEASIIVTYHDLPDPPPTRPRNIQPMSNIDRAISWAFLDRAANQTGLWRGFRFAYQSTTPLSC